MPKMQYKFIGSFKKGPGSCPRQGHVTMGNSILKLAANKFIRLVKPYDYIGYMKPLNFAQFFPIAQ